MTSVQCTYNGTLCTVQSTEDKMTSVQCTYNGTLCTVQCTEDNMTKSEEKKSQ